MQPFQDIQTAYRRRHPWSPHDRELYWRYGVPDDNGNEQDGDAGMEDRFGGDSTSNDTSHAHRGLGTEHRRHQPRHGGLRRRQVDISGGSKRSARLRELLTVRGFNDSNSNVHAQDGLGAPRRSGNPRRTQEGQKTQKRTAGRTAAGGGISQICPISICLSNMMSSFFFFLQAGSSAHSSWDHEVTEDEFDWRSLDRQSASSRVRSGGDSGFFHQRAAILQAAMNSIDRRTEAYGSINVVAALIAGFAVVLLGNIAAQDGWTNFTSLVFVIVVIALNLFAVIIFSLIAFQTEQMLHGCNSPNIDEAEEAVCITFEFVKETQYLVRFAIFAVLCSILVFLFSIAFYVWAEVGLSTVSGNISISIIFGVILVCVVLCLRLLPVAHLRARWGFKGQLKKVAKKHQSATENRASPQRANGSGYFSDGGGSASRHPVRSTEVTPAHELLRRHLSAEPKKDESSV